MKWAQSVSVLFEEQTGYKKGYSTIHNIFVPQSLAHKYISKPKGRYYVLCVDFSKALHKVSHKLPPYIILKYGYMLNKFGFNYIIIFSQNVDNEEIFLNVFKTRVKHYHVNELREKLRNSSKMAIYCTFIKNYTNKECQAYIKMVTVIKHHKALCKLRLSSHCLAIEKGRRENVSIAERICLFCEGMEISRFWKTNFILCAVVVHTVHLEHIIYFLNMQITIHLLILHVCLLLILKLYKA